MKKLFLFFLFFVLIIAAQCQVNGYIFYRGINNADTTQTIKDTTGQIFVLYFNRDSSFFKNINEKHFSDNNLIKSTMDSNENNTHFSIQIGDSIGYIVFKDAVNNILTERVQTLINKAVYIHDEALPNINWTLLDSSKNIGSFNCQQAVADFRGRHYTAWFTTDIPVGFGPWKLGGLPGMILEAYDDKKEVQWLFNGIKIPAHNIGMIVKPTQGIIISFEKAKTIEMDEFEKMKKIFMSTMPQDRNSITNIAIHTYPIEKNFNDQ